MLIKATKFCKNFISLNYLQPIQLRLKHSMVLSKSEGGSLAGPTQVRVLNELRSNGISIVSWDEFFSGDPSAVELFDEIKAEHLKFKKSEVFKSFKKSSDASIKRRKPYLVTAYRHNALNSEKSCLIRFGRHARITDLLAAYFGSTAILRNYDFWHTAPSKHLQPQNSQKWHRDPEDLVMCKVFLYLSDVDEEAGATEYIPNTFWRGTRYKKYRWWSLRIGEYVSDKEIGYPEEQIVKANGKAGSLVFLNTTGLHRGGHGVKQRDIVNMTFTTKAAK